MAPNFSKKNISLQFWFDQDIVSGAAPLGPDTHAAISERLGISRVRQGWGMSELSPGEWDERLWEWELQKLRYFPEVVLFMINICLSCHPRSSFGTRSRELRSHCSKYGNKSRVRERSIHIGWRSRGRNRRQGTPSYEGWKHRDVSSALCIGYKLIKEKKKERENNGRKKEDGRKEIGGEKEKRWENKRKQAKRGSRKEGEVSGKW